MKKLVVIVLLAVALGSCSLAGITPATTATTTTTTTTTTIARTQESYLIGKWKHIYKGTEITWDIRSDGTIAIRVTNMGAFVSSGSRTWTATGNRLFTIGVTTAGVYNYSYSYGAGYSTMIMVEDEYGGTSIWTRQ